MKNPKLKESNMLEFYAAVSKMTREETLTYCTEIMSSARAPNHTLINSLKYMDKDRIMIATNNFIMKGNGYGCLV